jgi:hypothetical protein
MVVWPENPAKMPGSCIIMSALVFSQADFVFLTPVANARATNDDDWKRRKANRKSAA